MVFYNIQTEGIQNKAITITHANSGIGPLDKPGNY
jgi:hypothetical protein